MAFNSKYPFVASAAVEEDKAQSVPGKVPWFHLLSADHPLYWVSGEKQSEKKMKSTDLDVKQVRFFMDFVAEPMNDKYKNIKLLKNALSELRDKTWTKKAGRKILAGVHPDRCECSSGIRCHGVVCLTPVIIPPFQVTKLLDVRCLTICSLVSLSSIMVI